MNRILPNAIGRLRDDPGPIYLKIASLLRRDIANDVLKPGQQLPALDQVARDFGVAIVTVRQAIAILEQEGHLYRRQGKGTFVAEAPPARQTLVIRSDFNSLLEHLEGKKPELLHVADKVAVPLVTPSDGRLAPAYRYMRRIHRWRGLGYALIDIYLDQCVYEMAPKLFDTQMVISTLANLEGIHIQRVRQRVAFTTADLVVADLLNVPVSSPIGDVRRVITDRDNSILYVGETKYRGDFVRLEFDIDERAGL